MSDLRETFGDDGDVGIGPLRGRGTDRLIGTASAGIAFSCLLRLRSRTVLCKDQRPSKVKET